MINMKKFLCLALIAALCSMLFVPALAQAPLAGGWTPAEDSAVPQEAADALQKAMEHMVGSNIEPVALLGTQVVAGTNYCLLCKITPVVLNPVPHYALVWLYSGVDGTASILEIQDISIQLPETPAE